MSDRSTELSAWLRRVIPDQGIELSAASEDASFRRYWRAQAGERSWIVMDAPPAHEDVRPFVTVARLLHTAGVSAPRVIAEDAANGFLLLTDFGNRLYLDALDNPASAAPLYEAAIEALIRMQATARRDGWQLPPYDRALLLREMALFRDWLLDRHLGIDVDSDMLEGVFSWLADNALEQPQGFVHRDYHSRNLMVCPGSGPGILDFQDAMIGPVSYDLVSLLRDCYVAWPAGRIDEWVRMYRQRARAAGLPVGVDHAQFRQWFDLTGVQRHLKAAGIFARLWHRDGKPGYLADVPRTLGYVVDVARDHGRLARLGELIERVVLPALADRGSPCAP